MTSSAPKAGLKRGLPLGQVEIQPGNGQSTYQLDVPMEFSSQKGDIRRAALQEPSGLKRHGFRVSISMI